MCKALESELFTARREIDRLAVELNGFKTLATELTRERDTTSNDRDNKIGCVIRLQAELSIERKALEEACSLIMRTPNELERIQNLPDYFRKKAKEA